jgi:tetratricopeptide (TPR) repeat protein
MTNDVFISYSSKNKQTADAVCHALEQNGIKCWIAPRDIIGGQKYGEVIENAIKVCKVFVIIFSEESKISPWVESELNIAFTDRRIIIPFKIDSSILEGEMRLMLNNKHWIEAHPNPEKEFVTLLKSIEAHIEINSTSKDKNSINKSSISNRINDVIIRTNSEHIEAKENGEGIGKEINSMTPINSGEEITESISKPSKETIKSNKSFIKIALSILISLLIVFMVYRSFNKDIDIKPKLDTTIVSDNKTNQLTQENIKLQTKPSKTSLQKLLPDNIIHKDTIGIDNIPTSSNLKTDYNNTNVKKTKAGGGGLLIFAYRKLYLKNIKNLVDSLIIEGHQYYEKCNYIKAIVCYSKVISIDSINVSAYTELAKSYFMNGEYEKAKSAESKAKRLYWNIQYAKIKAELETVKAVEDSASKRPPPRFGL